jgi:hypothetical protein
MALGDHAITAPADQLMLVALAVTLASDPTTPRATARPRAFARLGELSLDDLRRAAAEGALSVVIRYRGEALYWSATRALRQREAREQLLYCLRHGAPEALVRRLFKVSRERLQALRREHDLPSAAGRPRLPPPKLHAAIHARWHALDGTDMLPRARYVALHRAFPQYSLAALAALVRDAGDPRVRPPAQAANAALPRAHSSASPAPGAAGSDTSRTVLHRRGPR